MAVGSVYTARAPATNLITNLDEFENQLTYDTEVDTSADVTRQSGNVAFRLQNTGRYLIITSTGWDYSPIGNNNRHVVRTRVTLGGSDIQGITGMASGYGRDSGNADETHVCTYSYIDHTVVGDASDDIEVFVQNFGDVSVAAQLSDQFAEACGIQIIRLPDDDAWAQIERNADQSVSNTLDFSLNDGAWTAISFDNEVVESDSGVIEWVSGANITLKETAKYLAIWHTQGTSTNNRFGFAGRLTLAGTEVRGSRSVSYHRTTDGATEAWVACAVVFEATANDDLNLEWMSCSEATPNTLTINECAVTVIRLPDTTEGVSAYHNATRAGETTGILAMAAEDFDDAAFHDNSTNNSRISGNANEPRMLLFANWFLRNETADSSRTCEHMRWSITGSVSGTYGDYGGALSYTRGDQSANGVPAGGRSCGRAFDAGLGAAAYIEINYRQEATTGAQARDFTANTGFCINGLDLDSLVSAETIINVPVGALVLQGLAPTGLIQVFRTPGVGALVLAGQLPACAVGFTEAPPAGPLVLQGLAPTVFVAQIRQPGAGPLVLAGLAPELVRSIGIDIPVGSLVFAGLVPTLRFDLVLVPGDGELRFSVAPETSITLGFALDMPDEVC